jgi:eukaryotic-like serine/threonine-protein kinase
MDPVRPPDAIKVSFPPFDLDLRTRELFRDGHKLESMKPQSFRLLMTFLESRDGIASREEICDKVWPGHNGGLSNHNVNEAVRGLRKILGDSEHVRYIETINGVGYKLNISPQWKGMERANAAPVPTVVDTDRLPLPETPATKTRYAIWISTLVGLLCLTIGTWLLLRYRSMADTRHSHVEVMLSPFENKTNDSKFDDVLDVPLAEAMEQSPFVHLTPEALKNHIMVAMGRKAGEPLTHDAAREVCQRANAAVLVSGLIVRLNQKYVVELKAENCMTGERIADEREAADNEDRVIAIVNREAMSVRQRLGESAESIKKYDVPSELVATPSFVAMRYYSLGTKCLNRGDYTNAVSLGKRAIAEDRNFAAAYLLVGIAYGNLHEAEESATNLRAAYDLRNRVSEYERINIEASYYGSVTGDLDAERQVLGEWQVREPNDPFLLSRLGGLDLSLGKIDEAVTVYRRAYDLRPSDALNEANLGFAYIFAGQLDNAEAAVKAAKKTNPNSPINHEVAYIVALLKQDAAAMNQERAQLLGKPVWDDGVLEIESDGAANAGQFERARQLTEQACASARRSGQPETAASYEAESAVREALIGNVISAKREAQLALSHSQSAGVEGMAGLALALIGDAQAAQLETDLQKRFAKDTIVQFSYLPMIRAGRVLASRPDLAVSALEPALPYELGNIDNGAEFSLYPAYLRGDAYLKMHRGDAAVVEFRKVLDHPGIVWNEPIASLSCLAMARADKMLDHEDAARDQYRKFLLNWNHADPDVTPYREAKAEYAVVSK